MRIPQIHVTCDEPGCGAYLVAPDNGNLDAHLRSKGWVVLLGKNSAKYEYCPYHRTPVTVTDLSFAAA